MKQVVVANSTDVNEAVLRPVKVGDHSLLVTRVGGKVCAFSSKCPHLGLSLARGKVDGGTIRCPFHGSRFDLRTGANVEWVNALLRLPLPGWARGLMAMGRKPAALTMYEASESAGSVTVNVPD
jgi:nitrite reductase/ring-hydroxylating ferredoxin subunit